MTNVDEITAGTYELVALQWDKPTSEPGKPFTFIRYRRGDTFELDAEEARRLVTAGAVVTPGERERLAAEAARAQYLAAVAALPDALRAEMLGEPPVEPVDPAGFDQPNVPPIPPVPPQVDLSLSVDKIMEQVGEDPTLAAQTLEQEQATDQPRSTLVSRLQTVIDQHSG